MCGIGKTPLRPGSGSCLDRELHVPGHLLLLREALGPHRLLSHASHRHPVEVSPFLHSRKEDLENAPSLEECKAAIKRVLPSDCVLVGQGIGHGIPVSPFLPRYQLDGLPEGSGLREGDRHSALVQVRSGGRLAEPPPRQRTAESGGEVAAPRGAVSHRSGHSGGREGEE